MENLFFPRYSVVCTVCAHKCLRLPIYERRHILLRVQHTQTRRQTKNLQKLMVEVYKTINHLNPPYMWDLFTKKVVEYAFRIKILSELPRGRSQRFGTNSLKFTGSLLWDSLGDEIKTAKSLAIFKQKVRSWNDTHCTCNI